MRGDKFKQYLFCSPTRFSVTNERAPVTFNHCSEWIAYTCEVVRCFIA